MLWSGLTDSRTSDAVGESESWISMNASKRSRGVYSLVPVHL